jgi:hypothetical protein
MAALAAVAAGCGSGAPVPTVPGVGVQGASGGSGGASASAAPTASLDPRDAAVAWARCMREHGVDIPDPNGQVGTGGTQVDKGSPTFEAATTACQGLLPASDTAADAARDSAIMDQLLAYARCMREHGIDMPDPVTGGGTGSDEGGWGGGAPTYDLTSKAFHDADGACGGLNSGKQSAPEVTGPAATPGVQP